MNAPLVFWGRRKVPLVLQTEAAECGLACLAMVAGHYGHRTDLSTLRSRHSISLKGTTLATLIKIAARLHLNTRPVRLEIDALAQLRLPAILHWDLNHFVVLTQVKRGSAVILDPQIGRKVLNVDQVSKHFSGVALELAPSERFQAKTERQQITLKQLVGRLPGLAPTLTQLFLLAVVLEVFALASPWFLQLVLDHAVVAGDLNLLAVLAVGFLLLNVMRVAIGALRSWVALYVGTMLNLQMVTRLYSHLLRLPMPYFARRHLGDLVSRFESLSTIRRTVTNTFLEVVLDGMMAVVTGTMMTIYSPRLSLIVFGATALYGVLRLLRYGPLREATEDQIVCSAKQQSNFLETVRGIQSVTLFNRQSQRMVAYQNLAIETFNANIRIQKLRILFQALSGTLQAVENVAVIWLAGILVLQGGFSVGMLFAFLAYKSQFTSRVSNLIDNGIEFKMLELHRSRVADIALSEVEPESDTVDRPLDERRYDIEVRNLSVRYAETEDFVLRHLNLRVEEGESVAIIGPSGCGKTTLLRTILGLLPPTSGDVLIGGVSLKRLGPSYYRSLIGTVMQDDELFAGSIAENITFFDAEPQSTRVEACAKLAAIHEDIVDMPMGYDTLIGDMGTVLSGGQKQRVLLARALYKRPRILLLDEATSHLDVVRETEVSEGIRQLKLTRVIVAHRPETIASADRVVSLEEAQSPTTPPSGATTSPRKSEPRSVLRPVS